MISGLKLLIADDSATIQKVVELTFVDEGMKVASVGDGDQAISKLEEFAPDVVLADVVMPGLTGYEVCEAIKQSERFQHIPVMLLVGSFEPFDEAEARRVGADDVLTKPFQSIRQLVNRVGSLLGGSGSENEANTQRLSTLGLGQRPAAESEAREDERPPEGADHLMNTDELELTTADTKPLEEREGEEEREEEPAAFAGDDLMPNPTGEPVVDMAEPFSADRSESNWAGNSSPESTSVATADEAEMSYLVEPMQQTTPPPRAADEFDDVLLDLGDLNATSGPAADADSILDLEEEPVAVSQLEASQPELAGAGAGSSAVGFPQPFESDAGWSDRSTLTDAEKHAALDAEPAGGEQPAAADWEIVPSLITVDAQLDESEVTPDSPQSSMAPQGEAAAFVTEPASEAIGSERLSAADIDAIARRAVELMSDKVVREIAWEVVPELAELMIKRRMEEKS